LPILVPILANQLLSMNESIRTAAGLAFDTCISNIDSPTMFQILASIAQFGGNYKLKAAVIEKLCGICD
jgi:hypothetical protein